MSMLQFSSATDRHSIQIGCRCKAQGHGPVHLAAHTGIAHDVGSCQPPFGKRTAAAKAPASHASRRCCTVLCALPTRLAERHAQKAANGVARDDHTAGKRQKPASRSSVVRAPRRRLDGQDRKPEPGGEERRWHYRPADLGGRHVEYVPGRDELITPQMLAEGLDAYDEQTGLHVMWSTTSEAAAHLAEPLALKGLRLFKGGRLPRVTDGRASAGPVDLTRFLAQPEHQQEVEEAVERRVEALRAAGNPVPRRKVLHQQVVHVSVDGRKVFIGDQGDHDAFAAFDNWRSLPIQTWLGGMVADVPGSRTARLVPSSLSALLGKQEEALARAADALWERFSRHPATAAAARNMLQHAESSPARNASRIGGTPWNAYAFNIDFRTGPHVDSKNVPGSYSALFVFEVGAPFCGCFYMLPQYRIALDIRPALYWHEHSNLSCIVAAGVALFHRSGDARAGLHGNSALWTPNADSHRIALVLYQTDVKIRED